MCAKNPVVGKMVGFFPFNFVMKSGLNYQNGQLV
jgi:hypothetical protein